HSLAGGEKRGGIYPRPAADDDQIVFRDLSHTVFLCPSVEHVGNVPHVSGSSAPSLPRLLIQVGGQLLEVLGVFSFLEWVRVLVLLPGGRTAAAPAAPATGSQREAGGFQGFQGLLGLLLRLEGILQGIELLLRVI